MSTSTNTGNPWDILVSTVGHDISLVSSTIKQMLISSGLLELEEHAPKVFLMLQQMGHGNPLPIIQETIAKLSTKDPYTVVVEELQTLMAPVTGPILAGQTHKDQLTTHVQTHTDAIHTALHTLTIDQQFQGGAAQTLLQTHLLLQGNSTDLHQYIKDSSTADTTFLTTVDTHIRHTATLVTQSGSVGAFFTVAAIGGAAPVNPPFWEQIGQGIADFFTGIGNAIEGVASDLFIGIGLITFGPLLLIALSILILEAPPARVYQVSPGQPQAVPVPTPGPTIYNTVKKTADGTTIDVRKLTNREVRNLRTPWGTPFEQEKGKQGYPANADIYVDENGDYWIGLPGSNIVTEFP